MRVLGVDFGLKRIGLAFSEGKLAEPIDVVKNSSSVIEKIISFCQELRVEKIVVGLPEGKIAGRIRHFAKTLSRKSKLAVVYQDETLTTQEAIAKMIAAGKRKEYRQKKKDAFAAALILQNYLDRLQPQKRRKI